ncbi:uncharacterized protein LOC135106815 isoform X2 [Scylla paramamosain]|uniref:uncharacterized protein LOC135106815 isoform X2 n=1 Tax=Scylla paramamosain TaxID=85552 RepID=UPI003083A9BF
MTSYLAGTSHHSGILAEVATASPLTHRPPHSAIGTDTHSIPPSFLHSHTTRSTHPPSHLPTPHTLTLTHTHTRNPAPSVCYNQPQSLTAPQSTPLTITQLFPLKAATVFGSLAAPSQARNWTSSLAVRQHGAGCSHRPGGWSGGAHGRCLLSHTVAGHPQRPDRRVCV